MQPFNPALHPMRSEINHEPSESCDFEPNRAPKELASTHSQKTQPVILLTLEQLSKFNPSLYPCDTRFRRVEYLSEPLLPAPNSYRAS